MAIYYVRSGGAIGSYFTSPDASLSALQTRVGSFTNADIIYLASDHVNTPYGAATTFTFPNSLGLRLLSVNTTTLALEAGAVEQTGGFSLTINGTLYAYGVSIFAGTGSATSVGINLGNTDIYSVQVYDSCYIAIMSSATVAVFIRVSAQSQQSNRSEFIFNNCKFGFTATAQSIQQRYYSKFFNCFIETSKVAPTSLFTGLNSNAAYVDAINCNFSHCTNFWAPTNAFKTIFKLTNCLVPANIVNGTNTVGTEITLSGCSTSSDDHNYHFGYYSSEGVIVDNTSLYLTTGGASFKDTNGSLIPLSLYIASSSTASKTLPLKSPYFNVEISSIGSKTISVKLAYDSATALNDNDVWVEIDYMSNSSNALTSTVISAPVVSGTNSLDILATGTALTDTSEAWTGTSGWANKKTATLSKTVTANQIGWARARVCLAKASTTIYVDPQATVA